MTISVVCECGKTYRVSEQNRGRTVQCKSCGTALKLDDDSGESEFDWDGIGELETECESIDANDAPLDRAHRKTRSRQRSRAKRDESSFLRRGIAVVRKYIPVTALAPSDGYRVATRGGKSKTMDVKALRELLLAGEIGLKSKLSHPDWRDSETGKDSGSRTVRDAAPDIFGIHVLYDPLGAHITHFALNTANWCLTVMCIFAFPWTVVVALIYTALAATEENRLLHTLVCIFFGPIYVPFVMLLGLAALEAMVVGGIVGVITGVARLAFLPRAKGSLTRHHVRPELLVILLCVLLIGIAVVVIATNGWISK